MRILFVIPYFYPAEAFGGPVRVAYDVGKELVRRGHEVVVYTSDAYNPTTRLRYKQKNIDGIKVYYFQNLSMFFVKRTNLFFTLSLPKIMKLQLPTFDIIHAHEYTTYQNIILRKHALKLGIPYILQVHGSLPRIGRKTRKWFFDILYGKKILKDASRVLALSPIESQQYQNAGIAEQKIVIVPNGIDARKYETLPIKNSFKKKCGIGADKKIILYLGRIHKSKGIDLLVNAYAKILSNRQLDDIVLILAGPDDGYLYDIKKVSASYKITSIVYTGFLNGDDKISALVDADVFVTPAFHGFPLTFLEACAVGTPIVTTSLGDSLDWINNTVGYMTEPNSDSLAAAIEAIITHNHEHDIFSKNGKVLVQYTFSLSKVVDRLEQIYKEVIAEKYDKSSKSSAYWFKLDCET